MLGKNFLTALIGFLPSSANAVNSTPSCTPATFSDVSLQGSKILDISTSLISNFSSPASAPALNHYPAAVIGLNVCEANITYTHPGQNDTITTSIWLPLKWNGRMMGIGGGGWMTGYYFALPWPASKGYAAVMTDGGHVLSESNTWGLKSPGNVDWVLLNDFASIALEDAATLGKAAMAAFYGERPKFSYYNGCSTGGRQGYMIAQRYPELYDGILATAPGINWDRLMLGLLHPQVVMTQKNIYPPMCEIDAFSAAAISACDELDGVKDGFILDPSSCYFDPMTVIGQPFNCSSTGKAGVLSVEGATIASAAWSSVRTEDGRLRNGRPLWYGPNRGAPLLGVADTVCTSSGNNSSTTCVGNPLAVSIEWVKYYLAKDETFDFKTVTRRQYDTLFRKSINQYSSIIGTSDADLTDFKESGGKLLSWHGLEDQLLSLNNTVEYWERVKEQDPDIDDYYRLFAAPGVLHCSGGKGWFPGDAMDSLVDWVEKKVVPDHLKAKTVGAEKERVVELCKWPSKLVFLGGDTDVAESYTCK
ncbi:Tannase/feruloyl esterase [Rhexocercosporidium sp. MPI-PUGE-AT-0058]|nr:Tannase/feruloyl esterase [Rhexocercosporidium sp. MPI-PUGE-AT-0058]